MNIMGIDVGFNGGIAMINVGDKSDVVYAEKMSTVKTDVGNELNYKVVWDIMHMADVIYIEKAQAMPKNGAIQAFKYGGGFYALRCIASLIGKRVTYVNPQTWKKVLLKDMDKSKKESSITRAIQLYGGSDLVKNILAGNKKFPDGIADAICIAEYGRREEIASG
jgi:hypothetical protein